MSSLSHSMIGAVLHRRIEDRHGLVEPLARQHETADVLREMTREAERLSREIDGLAQLGIARVETSFADMSFGDLPVSPCPRSNPTSRPSRPP